MHVVVDRCGGEGRVMVSLKTVKPTSHHIPFSSSSSAMTNTSACTFLYRLLGRSDWLTCLMFVCVCVCVCVCVRVCVCVCVCKRLGILLISKHEPAPFYWPCHLIQGPLLTDLSCFCEFQKVPIFAFNRCDFSRNPAANCPANLEPWRGSGVIKPCSEIRQNG